MGHTWSLFWLLCSPWIEWAKDRASQWCVVGIRAAFTSEASLFVYQELLLAPTNFVVYGPGRLPFTTEAPQFAYPEAANVQAKVCLLSASENEN
jgi:hypothetical protein